MKNLEIKKKIRPPVVVLLGHIDHGKTSLLEAVSGKKFLEKEIGGITQRIRALQIEKNGKKITFIDTPGHEAFLELRKKGVKVADIALLVIAADEGIKPQTIEAIDFIQENKSCLVVVITKIDKKEANIQKIKQQLAEKNILVEDFGGKIVCQEVSSKEKRGIDHLFEIILLLAEMENLEEDLKGKAEGIVIESWLDSKRGIVSNILVKKGILKEEEYFSCGQAFGKIKLLEDFEGKRLKEAFPSAPVRVLGFNKIVRGGEIFQVEENLSQAKNRAENFSKQIPQPDKEIGFPKEFEEKILKIIIKADQQGTLEAVQNSLEKIDKEKIKILEKGVGDIFEKDIFLAKSSGALIFGFNVKINKEIKELAKREGIRIEIYHLIYELIDEIKKILSEMIEPEIIEESLGKIKVVVIFRTISREKEKEMIIGGKIVQGKIEKGIDLKIFRDEKEIGQAKLLQLQIEKRNIQEAKKGAEIGMRILTETKIEVGDIIEGIKFLPA